VAGTLLDTDVRTDIGRELAELRAVVVELGEALRRIEERTARVERAVGGLLADGATGPRPRPVHGRHRRRGSSPGHRARTGPQLRYAAATAMIVLPWVLCVACFAAALGLIALSTFS
jgi:hypothetical protein